MKTPIQQIKDFIENADWDSPEVNERIVNWIDDNMSELLETEKEIIEEAFLDGYTHSPDEDFPAYAREYYYEKFSQ